MRVLFLGDIVGQPGRRILSDVLASIKKEKEIDVCVANAENAAAGFGLSFSIAKDLFSFGVDAITMGNHTFARDDIFRFIESEPRIVRPLNVSDAWPGADHVVLDRGVKGKLLVFNLLGRVGMAPADNPFAAADHAVKKYKESSGASMCLVDFHAETTSEKVAMGYHLDGRVSMVVGTHTHVRTADERILACGTGVITDVGMTGAVDGVIGMSVDSSLRRFVDQLPSTYEVAKGRAMINGVIAALDPQSGKCTHIERFYTEETEFSEKKSRTK